MRRRYEPLWNMYGVDLLLFGHVHAYERTNPVANYTADPTGCAPTYITIGEGSEDLFGWDGLESLECYMSRSVCSMRPYDWLS